MENLIESLIFYLQELLSFHSSFMNHFHVSSVHLSLLEGLVASLTLIILIFVVRFHVISSSGERSKSLVTK